jgi:hypothetical protein
MFFVLLFFVLLFILFLLSRQMTRNLSYLVYRLTGNDKVTIYVMAFLFFPGTFVHELSHALVSLLLFVHVGKMEFIPKVMEHGVKLGSVEIGHADPLRRALIGMAPFFLGTTLLLLTLTLFLAFGGLENIWLTVFTGYVLFEISNTMFSSRKDMEGTLELLLALLVVSVFFYLIGLRLPNIDPETILTSEVVKLFTTGSYFLTVPLVIDIVLITILKLLRSVHH